MNFAKFTDLSLPNDPLAAAMVIPVRLSWPLNRTGRAPMSIVALRVFIYSVLPVLAATIHVALDKSCRSRQRTLEIFLLYLFGVGVAGSGIGGFFGHFFLSDTVAQSIGWPKGNPFQLEVGFANLAVGILGIVAMASARRLS